MQYFALLKIVPLDINVNYNNIFFSLLLFLFTPTGSEWCCYDKSARYYCASLR